MEGAEGIQSDEWLVAWGFSSSVIGSTIASVIKYLIFLLPVAALAFGQTDTIALTANSDVSILKTVRKQCPNVSIVNNVQQSGYTFEVHQTQAKDHTVVSVEITLLDRGGKSEHIDAASVNDAVTGMCEVHGWDSKESIKIEVVDTATLTQSVDARMLQVQVLAGLS